MTFDTIKYAIRLIAPTIATALGGPLAGAAAAALSKSLLGHEDATVDEIGNAIQSATPDMLLKLKQDDHQFQLETLKLEQADRADARNREVGLAQAGKEDNTKKVMAYIITLGFLIAMITVFFVPIQISMKDISYILLGYLGGNFNQVIGYYFGTSSSSKAKDSVIAQH